jgi:DNA-binding NtrC family response regulator
MAKILVIDDEMGIRELLSEILDDEGHEILLAQNAAVARPLYTNHNLDLVLLDIWMPDTDGMSLLREWTIAAPLRCPVIMMSGHASIDTAAWSGGFFGKTHHHAKIVVGCAQSAAPSHLDANTICSSGSCA